MLAGLPDADGYPSHVKYLRYRRAAAPLGVDRSSTTTASRCRCPSRSSPSARSCPTAREAASGRRQDAVHLAHRGPHLPHAARGPALPLLPRVDALVPRERAGPQGRRPRPRATASPCRTTSGRWSRSRMPTARSVASGGGSRRHADRALQQDREVLHAHAAGARADCVQRWNRPGSSSSVTRASCREPESQSTIDTTISRSTSSRTSPRSDPELHELERAVGVLAHHEPVDVALQERSVP